MTGEDWVEAAMADDSMVVELLLGLKQAEAARKAPPLEWRVRQRRSKPVASSSKNPAPRASPNTPLSWSGGATSGSAAAADGGPEESSRLKLARNARSEVAETSEKAATKRLKRKKTLAELKQEEAMLVKERRQLKKDLAKLRADLETQRATNEKLKRMKLDLQPQPQNGSSTVTVEEDRVMLPDLNLPVEEDNI